MQALLELHLLLQVTTLTVCALLEAAEAAGKDKWLVQTAGGSALGRQIISMAKHRGIKLVSLVRRAAQKDELLQLGCACDAFPWQYAWVLPTGLACSAAFCAKALHCMCVAE